MNILKLFGFAILLTSDFKTFVVGESTTLKTTTEERTLLKELQNFQEPKNETKPLMWNEILADVLVNKVKIFSLKHDNITKSEETQHNTLTKWFGNVLIFYKEFIYDKFFHSPEENNILKVTELSERGDEENDVGSDINQPDVDLNHLQDIFVNEKINLTSPKGDVEIVEPKYHGRLTEEDEKVEEEDKAIVCPEGYVKSDRGCMDSTSRLILAIPNQCPNGYRLDLLGYCRKIFVFQ